MADLTITNLEELKAFRDRVNSGESFSGQTVVLAADIDLKNEEWTPIGNSTNKFQGTFDGQGHTISNLNVNNPGTSYQGFFGFATDGAIKNVNFHNATVRGRGGVGVVAGSPYTSDLSNITLTGKIIVEGKWYVGGVAGRNCYGDFSDITVNADEGSYVKVDSVDEGTAFATYAGGVAGFLGEGSAHWRNVTSNISVEGSTCYVGGIAGIAHYGTIFENVSCTADSVTVNDNDSRVGAIAGTWNNTNGTSVTMINCTASNSTSVKQVVTDENGNTTTTELGNVVNGAAYDADNTGDASGKLLMATEKTDAYGAVALEITKVDANGTGYTVSQSEVKKVAAADTGATSFIVGDCEVAGYEGSNVVMDADGKIVGGSFTATEAADSAAFSAALSENVQQQTDGSIANLSMISVDDDYAALTEGTVIAPGIIFGVNAFATIQDAVKAATDGATIVIKGGTYNDDVILTKETVPGAPKALNFVAASGEEVICGGTFQIGKYVQGPFVPENFTAWNKQVTIDGLTFKLQNELDASLELQDVNGVTVKNCKFVAEADKDYYHITKGAGWKVYGVSFDNCSFAGGRIQPTAGTDAATGTLGFNGCTFTDVKINLTGGNYYAFNNSVFNYKFFNDANGEPALSYAVRSDDAQNVKITNSVFNIDVTDDFAPVAGDFGVLWGRKAGSAAWVIEGSEVNYSAAALELASKDENFAFIYNGSTDFAKELERFTVVDLTSKNSAEELAQILASTHGVVNVVTGGVTTIYNDGEAMAAGKIAVDSSFTANGSVVEVNGEKYLVGANAFASLKDAADKAVDGVVIDISGATDSAATFVNGGTVTLTGDAEWNWNKGWFYIGRGKAGAQDSTVVIKNAAITSNSNSTALGFNVSNAKINSSDTKNGTLILENSTVEVDYMQMKNRMDVIGDGDYNDGEVDLYVKNGFLVGGRGASETVDGVDHTAEMNISDGAYVKIFNENGMGIAKGENGKGVLNIADSKFESEKDFTVGTKGVLNIDNGELVVAGKLNNSGTINVSGASDISAKISGTGMVYLRDAALDADTEISGSGRLRFVKGENTITGSTINAEYFQVGTRREDSNLSGESVKLTVKDATITCSGSSSESDSGWVGSGYNIAAVDGVTYTMALENTAAAFSYLHISDDGNFSVTGSVSDDRKLYRESEYRTFYAGNFIVNGNATFKNTDVRLQKLSINCDNQSNGKIGKLTVDGSYLRLVRSGGTGDFRLWNGGVLSVVNDSYTYARNITFDAGSNGEVLTGSTFNVDALTNNGTITVDADSLFKAGVLTNNGSIIIDASGFTGGVKKVIDLNGTAALDVAGVTFTNVAAGVNTVFGADGDVTLVKKEVGTLYVKDSYISDDAVNAEVGGSLAYGVDAFSSVKSAFEKAIELGGGTINVLGTPQDVVSGSDYNSLIKMTGASGMDFVLTGTNAGNEFAAIEMRNAGATEAEEDFVLVNGKKATLLVTDADMAIYKLAAYTNSVITIENSTLDFRDAQNGLIYTKGNGEMYVSNSVLKNMNQLSARGTLLAVTESLIDGGSGNTVYGGTMSLVDSTFNYSGMRIGDGGVLMLENTKMVSNSVKSAKEAANKTTIGENEIALYVGYGNAGSTAAVTTGTLNLKNSEFSIAKGQKTSLEGVITDTTAGTVNVSESGTVNVEDSKFSADVVNNSGDFNVSGVSQLNIGTLTGKVELNGATLTDSVIGGGAGDVHAYGNVIVENATFNNNTGNRSGLTVMGGTTELRGDISAIELGTQHARDTGVEKVLVIGENANVSVGYTGENDGEDLKVGFLYARNDAEIIVEKDGNLYLNGQLSNRGTITLKGNMVVAGVNGAGAIHLAGAGDADEYGTMNIVGGTLSDRQTSHVNANYLYMVTDMKIGDDGDINSAVNVTEGGKIATTNSYWDILADGELNVTDGSVDIDAPTNNPGVGVSWIPRDYVMTNAGKIAISNSKFDVVSLNNSGDFNVSGVSQLNIGTLTGTVDVIGGTVKDSNVGGNVLFTGDATVDGENKVGIAKVNNDATMTVAEGAVLNADYVLAGNDNYFPAIANNGNGGTVIIDGTVNVSCNLNADNGGKVIISETGKVKSANTVAVESGDMTGTAGEMIINGQVETVFFHVFGGGSATVGETGKLTLGVHETVQDRLTVQANSSLTVNGEVNVLSDRANIHSTGKLNVVGGVFNATAINNAGTITVDALSSITATSLTNSGTITIDATGYTGDSVKIIDLNQNGQLANVKVKGNGKKYYLAYGADGDVTLMKSPETVYVSSDYNSSTEGWGYTKFNSWDGAYAFTSANAKNATIVFEKTTTVSGNCFPKQADGVAAIIVKDGATVGNANSKWDAVFAMTIEAGGILQSARPASAGYGNTHVKNKWIIGEAGADKRAEIRFINGKSGIGYQTMSIALLNALNRSITANNALIEVGDFGLQSNASFTDTTLTIDGILAIRGNSLYKTTMTDTTVTIKGHNLMNENTYYSTVGTILSTLTMDNTSIVVDDGVDSTVAEKVWLGDTGNVYRTLTMTNGSSITVEKGTEVEVANKVTMTGSTITAGTVNAVATSTVKFSNLAQNTTYWAVLYDADGNELETIKATTANSGMFFSISPGFSAQPVGSYTAILYEDEAKTIVKQEKTCEFVANGSIDMTESKLYADKLNLAGDNAKMDIDSTIGFNSITGGYVTVTDANSYVDNAGVNDGNYLLFDYTGDGSMTEADYQAILNNQWHNNYKVINNDLYLTDQNNDILYVNSAYTADNADGHLYGYNAFSTVKAAGKQANSQSGATIDLGDEKYVYAKPLTNDADALTFTNAGNYTITGGKGVLLNYEFEINPDKLAGQYNVDIDNAFVTLTKFTLRDNANVEITDSRLDFDPFLSGSWFSIYRDSNLTVNGSTIGYSANKTGVADPTEFLANNSPAGKWSWGTVLQAYGDAEFNNSLLFLTDNEGGHSNFSVKGNGNVTFNDSYISNALFNVGFGGVDSKYFGTGDDISNLCATLTISGSTVRSSQYRGDSSSSGIRVGDADRAGKLVIENSDVDMTVIEYFGNEYGLTVNNAASSVKISGSTVKVTQVANAGTITVDHASTIAFGALTNSGTITIDTTGYTDGSYKVLDYTGTGSMDYSFVSGFGTNDKLIVVDNDLYVSDADNSIIYVNKDYTAENADGRLYGYNAFSTVSSALASKTSATKQIVVNSNMTENFSNLSKLIISTENAGSTTVTSTYGDWFGLDGSTVSQNVNLVANDVFVQWASKPTVIDGSLTTNDQLYVGYDAILNINGTVKVGGSLISRYNELSAGINVNGNGSGETQLDVDYYIGHYSESFNAKDTKIDAGYVLLDGGYDSQYDRNYGNGPVYFRYNAATMNLDNTVFTITGTGDGQKLFRVAGDAVLNLTNGSQLNGVRDFHIGATEIDSTETATGIVNITGSTVNAENVNNNGTITVDYTSTIAFGTLTNSGTITIDTTGYTDGEYLIFDYTGTGSKDMAFYESILGDLSSRFTVKEGDLYYSKANATATIHSDGSASFDSHGAAINAGCEELITLGGEFSANVAHEGLKSTINDGAFTGTVAGGANINSSYKVWSEREGDTNLVINDGTFAKHVIGADRVDAGSFERIGNANLTINGGEFSYNVFGGLCYVDTNLRGQAILTGNVNLNINGGTFNELVYGGSGAANEKYSSRAIIVGDVTTTINAVNDIEFGRSIVAGSFDNGVIDGNVKVVFKGDGSKITFAAGMQVWGGCTADVYYTDRTFESAITGDRNFTFDAYTGNFSAYIRGFNSLDVVNGSNAVLAGADVSDVNVWTMETGSTLSGSFGNDFDGDTLEVAIDEAWNEADWTLLSGNVTNWDKFSSVKLGSETATFENGAWVSASYDLTLSEEDGKKSLVFGKLA